ncbi:MAG: response regulator transcription factor [Bacteroidota bacterium]
MNHEIRHILFYSFILAVLIFGLRWLQWNFIVLDNAIDIYIGLIAIIFTILGVWIASQSIRPKTQKIVVEKQIFIPRSKTFTLNERALKKLELTNREFEILQLIAKGHSNSKIADQLFLSLSTIKTHVSNLFTKMNVNSRYHAITKAKELEIVE